MVAFSRAAPRDLLPLPYVTADDLLPAGSSRSSRQKVSRARAAVESTNEAIWAVNALNGQGQKLLGLRPSQAQRSAVRGLLEVCREDAPPPDTPAPEAALHELLGCRAPGGYSADDPLRVAPFSRELISWPGFAGGVALREALPAEELAFLADGGALLQLPAEKGAGASGASSTPRAYWDETLRKSPRDYAWFIRELLARGMVNLRRTCRHRVGCFFVYKKSGRLRLVVDARAPNARLRPPPCTRLASTSAVVEVRARDDQQFWFSAQDVCDCFYQFALPVDWQDMFGFMDITAGALGINVVDGCHVSPSEVLVPCLSVLPMGFSWALHWSQEAHRFLLRKHGLGDSSSEWVDRRPAFLPEKHQVAKLIYVDNELFIAGRPKQSIAARSVAQNRLGAEGLHISRDTR